MSCISARRCGGRGAGAGMSRAIVAASAVAAGLCSTAAQPQSTTGRTRGSGMSGGRTSSCCVGRAIAPSTGGGMGEHQRDQAAGGRAVKSGRFMRGIAPKASEAAHVVSSQGWGRSRTSSTAGSPPFHARRLCRCPLDLRPASTAGCPRGRSKREDRAMEGGGRAASAWGRILALDVEVESL